MGFTKEQLLARLKELQIDFSQYQHPVVLTVEAQAKYVGDKGGGLSKNLFLKDKKSRFYIVSALADTKVDLKVLSQRLGLGKGGLRMAPEEALCEILQVPLGCVTPFALINESSRHVSLLLDKGFKTQEHCFFHPLSNDMSISLSSCDLDKFLRSIGRDPSYIDLEANPPVGKDHPPDLAALVPTDSVSLSDPLENTAPLQAPAANLISSDKKSTTTAGTSKLKAANPLDSVQDSKENVASKPGDKPTSAAHRPGPVSDVGPFVEEILKKLSALLLSEMTEDAVGQHGKQLGTQVVDSISKRLGPDLQSHATMFKNTAYTQGFYAGAHHQPKRL